MQHVLEAAGYVPDATTQVWTRPDFAGIAYSDGDTVEEAIAGIVAAATDLSVLSPELRRQATDWPRRYHLAPTRANILRPLAARLQGARILEIGAGCGAITRFLGECGAEVLALEGTPRRAAIARSRTRDQANVTVVTDRFEDFTPSAADFDIVTLIGVLEYANLYSAAPDPTGAMLAHARRLLKPAGLLVVAIENQLGLKYFAGAGEDHLGTPMYGIEDRYRRDQPRTFGKRELVARIEAAGFAPATTLAPLPDYKHPVSIIGEAGFAHATFDAASLLRETVRRDPQLPAASAFSPELVWPVLHRNGLASDLANSLLVLAGGDPGLGETCAWHYSVERAPQFCKETRFVPTPDGGIQLSCSALAGPQACANPHGQLLHVIEPTLAYVPGALLASSIDRVLATEGWRTGDLAALLRPYVEALPRLIPGGQTESPPDTADTPVAGACFDLVPRNIVVSDDGVMRAIDREWTLTSPLPFGWLVFRAALHSVQAVSRFGRRADGPFSAPVHVVQAFAEAAGITLDDAHIEDYARRELAIRAEVEAREGGLEEDHRLLLQWLRQGELVFDNMVTLAARASGLVQIAGERDNAQTMVEALLTEREALYEQNRMFEGERQARINERDALTNHRDHIARERDQIAADRDRITAEKDRVTSERDRLIARSEAAEAALEAARLEAERLQGQADALRAELDALLGSSSWRLTAPLRAIGDRARKHKG